MKTLNNFIKKYGTCSASMVLNALAERTSDPELSKVANEIAIDLEDVLVNANCTVDVELSKLIAGM